MSSSLTDECNLLREYFQSTWLKCRLLPGKMNIQRLIGHGVTSKMSHQRRMGLIGKALFEDMNVTLWNEDNVTYLKHTKKAQTPKPKPKPLKVLKEGDKTGWFNVHVPVYSLQNTISEVTHPQHICSLAGFEATSVRMIRFLVVGFLDLEAIRNFLPVWGLWDRL